MKDKGKDEFYKRLYKLEQYLEQIEGRLNTLEQNIFDVYRKITKIEGQIGVEGRLEEEKIELPSEKKIVELPVETPTIAPTPKGKAYTEEELATMEFEIGGKWLQRIGIIILAIAFVILGAYTIKYMTSWQKAGCTFLSAAILSICGEYIYRFKKWYTYARGLVFGGMLIGYVGCWGLHYYYGLVNFNVFIEITIVLIIINLLLSYRFLSDIIAVQGILALFILASVLRYVIISPFNYGLLLCLITGLFALIAYHRRSADLVLVTIFLSNIWIIYTSQFLIEVAFLPLLVITLITVILVTLYRTREDIISPYAKPTSIIWVLCVLLSYAALVVNYPQFNESYLIGPFFAIITVSYIASHLICKDEKTGFTFLIQVSFFSLLLGLITSQSILLFVILLLSMLLIFSITQYHLDWTIILFAYTNLIILTALGQFHISTYLHGYEPWIFLAVVYAIHFYFNTYLKSDIKMESLSVISPYLALMCMSLFTYDLTYSSYIYLTFILIPMIPNKEIIIGRIDTDKKQLFGLLGLSTVLSFLFGKFLILLTGVPDISGVTIYLDSLVLFVCILFSYLTFRLKLRDKLNGYWVSAPMLILLLLYLATTPMLWFAFITLPIVIFFFSYQLKDTVSLNISYLLVMYSIWFNVSNYFNYNVKEIIILSGIVLFLFSVINELYLEKEPITFTAFMTSSFLIPFSTLYKFWGEIYTTLSWTLFGFVAIFIGLYLKKRYMRWMGLGFIFTSIGKAFIYDLAGLPFVMRVLSFTILGSILIVISYVYTKHKDIIFERLGLK